MPDMTVLIGSTTYRFKPEGYKYLSAQKQGHYKLVGVNDKTLQILQDRLETSVSILRQPLSTNLRRHFDQTNYSMKQEARSVTESDQSCSGTENMCVVKETARHICTGPSVRCAVRWYGCSRMDDNAEFIHHIPSDVVETCWRRFEK